MVRIPALEMPPPAPVPALLPPTPGAPPSASLSVRVVPWTVRTVGAPRLVGKVDGPSLKRPPPRPLPPLPPAPPAPPRAWSPLSVLPETVRIAPKTFATPPPNASSPLPPSAPWPPTAWLSAIVLLLTAVVLAPGGPPNLWPLVYSPPPSPVPRMLPAVLPSPPTARFWRSVTLLRVRLTG